MKKIYIAALVLTLGTSFFGMAAPDAYAAENQQGAGQKKEERRGPPRRPQMTLPEMQLVLSQKYFVTPEEVKALLAEGEKFQDIQRAALYSYVTGRPVKEILALKKDEPWERVAVLTGAVGDRMYEKSLELDAENLHRWWGIDKKMALHYLKQGYPTHYVKVAYVISKHSDWTMEAVLKDKKYGENWKAWCKRHLGIDGATYDAWIGEYKNPTYLPGKFF